MKVYSTLALFALFSLALGADVLTLQLTKPGSFFSVQPLSSQVPIELRSGDGGVVAIYKSQQSPQMLVLIGNDGTFAYLQVEKSNSYFFANELRWLSKIGALSGLSEDDFTQIASLAPNAASIQFSPSFGKWLAGTPTPQSEISNSAWQRSTAGEAAKQEGSIAPISQSSTEPSLPQAADSQQARKQPPLPAQGSQSLPSDSSAASGSIAQQAQPISGEITPIGQAESQKTLAAYDAQAQPAPSFDFSSLYAPILTAAAVLMAIIVAVLMRSPSNEAAQEHRILSSPTRIEILNELSQNDKIPTDLSSRLGKSKATIIEHLERMQQAGFVEKVQTPGRKFVYYKITSKGKTALLRSAA